MLEENTEERIFMVNDVSYASDTITINEINMQIKDNMVTLGDYSDKENEETYKQITGYYDQSGAIYNIYMLVEDKNGKTMIWKTQKNNNDSFDNIEWINKSVNNATDHVLVNCTETLEPVGQTPLRYQVYALVNNDLVLVD